MRVPLPLKYFYFIYILAISTFEYFFRISQPATYLLFPIAALTFYYYRKKFDYSALFIILPFFLSFVLQNILNGTPIYFAFTLIIRFITLYFVIKIIGEDFITIFINTIKVFAIISLFFYVLQFISPIYALMIKFSQYFVNLGSNPEFVIDRPNFIIYVIQGFEEVGLNKFRNSGPFWEPGLYVVFLNIALFFNLLIEKDKINKVNVIFFISIITTLSTTGFIVLILILSYFSLSFTAIELQYRLLMVIILISSIPLIMTLPFMTEKINTQIDQSDLSYSRFGAAVVHWKIITDYPYAGLPYDSNKSYSKYADKISPNGITEIFIRYGIFTGLFFYILLFRSCRYLTHIIGQKKEGYILFIIMVILIFSQTIGNTPIYLLFLFIPLIGEININRNKLVKILIAEEIVRTQKKQIL